MRSKGQPALSALTLVLPRGRLGSYLGWLKSTGRRTVIYLITFLRSHSIQSLRVCVEDPRKTNKMSYDSLVNLIDPWADQPRELSRLTGRFLGYCCKLTRACAIFIKIAMGLTGFEAVLKRTSKLQHAAVTGKQMVFKIAAKACDGI